MTVRSVSYGGGVQSTALLVLAAERRIDFPLFLFANVGPKAENPDTIAYVQQHARPYAEGCGIELVELRWVTRQGVTRDLYDDLTGESRIGIPVRLASGAFGTRNCTSRYKIEVVGRELRKRGATAEAPAVIAIGISTDEYQRAKVGVPKQQPWTTRVNPLLDLGISRIECERIIAAAGLPVPPKSSCWFCPYQSKESWRRRKRNQPELFDRAVALEATLNDRRESLGADRIGLASATATLDLAIDDQQQLDGFDGCDSGWCMT